MKKILIIFALFLLAGCDGNEYDIADSGAPITDDDGKVFGVVESIEYGPDFSGIDDLEVNFTYLDTYFSFQDLLDDIYPKFYYGKVSRIEENNVFVDSLFFEVIKSENNEVLGEIRVSVEKDQTRLIENGEYVLYLHYNKEYSYYSLSNPYKSIFLITGEEVQYSDAFEDLYHEVGSDKERFLDKIFE